MAKQRRRVNLATAALTDAVRKDTKSSSTSTLYRDDLPWKLKFELGEDEEENPFPVGWGFAVRFEFSIPVFATIWYIVALVLILCLIPLFTVPRSPAYGQVGAIVAISVVPFPFVTAWFGIVTLYAKQKDYLK